MTIRQRRKCASAGRELARLLREHLGDGICRNLAQVRDGGANGDLLGLTGLCLEIKRAARPRLAQWWMQACSQADPDSTPALAYRLDWQEWQFMLPLGAIHQSFPAGDTRLTVTMGLQEFAAVVRGSLSSRTETGDPRDG